MLAVAVVIWIGICAVVASLCMIAAQADRHEVAVPSDLDPRTSPERGPVGRRWAAPQRPPRGGRQLPSSRPRSA